MMDAFPRESSSDTILFFQLAKFLDNLTFPIVCANFKTNDTEMNAVNIKPYTVIEKHNLGIIGVITPDTKGISMPFPANDTQ
jgi:2',3'-cyclic-nucleotide 2'-phosphodiesterase (5'-nucleotidase family)